MTRVPLRQRDSRSGRVHGQQKDQQHKKERQTDVVTVKKEKNDSLEAVDTLSDGQDVLLVDEDAVTQELPPTVAPHPQDDRLTIRCVRG